MNESIYAEDLYNNNVQTQANENNVSDQEYFDSSKSVSFSEGNKSTTNKNALTYLVTNARSLAPKANSLATNIQELDAAFAIVSESWLKEGNRLDRHLIDLENGEDLKIIHKSRKSKRGKTAGGGTAIVFNKKKISLREYKIRREHFEIVSASGKLNNNPRKVVIFGIYIPPSMRAKSSDRALELLSDAIQQAKNDFHDPMIFVGGDFNKRNIQKSLESHPLVTELDVPPTRMGAKLNLVASNIPSTNIFKLPPLTTYDGQKKSDHDVLAIDTVIPVEDRFTWRTYTTRPRSAASNKQFIEAFKKIEWPKILTGMSVDMKVATLTKTLNAMMDQFFPKKTYKVRSTDNPWISYAIRKKIRARKKIFRKEGRSKKWKRLKQRTDQAIKTKKEAYYKRFKDKATTMNDPALYYKAIRGLKDRNKPQEFNVMDLRPNASQADVREELADFFSAISADFSPLDRSILPISCQEFVNIKPYQIEQRLRKCKKPKSMVDGDIFPDLISPIAGELSHPLANIFNDCLNKSVWPKDWKTENVTVIPKCPAPEDFNGLRNISCTPLFSKVLEHFVLERLQNEISPKLNQYGGTKGTGTAHYLVDAWNSVLETIEDPGFIVNLTSVDFSKAFNTMSHEACVKKLMEKGASDQSLSMVAAFLEQRRMRIKMEDSFSTLRPLPGGSPQGTLLGNFLYIITTDNIEETRNDVQLSNVNRSDEPNRPPLPVTDDGQPSPQPSNPSTGSVNDDSDGSDESFRYFDNRSETSGESFSSDSFYSAVSGENIIDQSNLGPALKFVDDLLGLEATKVYRSATSEDEDIKIRARGSEKFFKSVQKNAVEIGMSVNPKKTQMLAIDPASRRSCRTFIQTDNGEDQMSTLTSGNELKLLGFYFGRSPDASRHVWNLKRKFWARAWILRHLRKANLPVKDLIKVYKSLILPVLDYSSVVYHSLLKKGEEKELEDLQKRHYES